MVVAAEHGVRVFWQLFAGFNELQFIWCDFLVRHIEQVLGAGGPADDEHQLAVEDTGRGGTKALPGQHTHTHTRTLGVSQTAKRPRSFLLTHISPQHRTPQKTC